MSSHTGRGLECAVQCISFATGRLVILKENIVSKVAARRQEVEEYAAQFPMPGQWTRSNPHSDSKSVLQYAHKCGVGFCIEYSLRECIEMVWKPKSQSKIIQLLAKCPFIVRCILS
uniref:Uncharacterized protein n=1 Tax=Cacopsylla melanoneura TaxID=428564 RepID=A0A8D8W344_9HEMI